MWQWRGGGGTILLFFFVNIKIYLFLANSCALGIQKSKKNDCFLLWSFVQCRWGFFYGENDKKKLKQYCFISIGGHELEDCLLHIISGHCKNYVRLPAFFANYFSQKNKIDNQSNFQTLTMENIELNNYLKKSQLQVKQHQQIIENLESEIKRLRSAKKNPHKSSTC